MKEIIIFIVILILGFYIVGKIAISEQEEMQEQCETRFGKEWTYRSGRRSPDICVNANGDVKYL